MEAYSDKKYLILYNKSHPNRMALIVKSIFRQ